MASLPRSDLRRSGPPEGAAPRFMSVRQVADYLQLNEKKVYALANEGGLPATKVTGKWIFPRELVDDWLLASSHGGLLTDRLLLAGGGDPLLARVVTALAGRMEATALVACSTTGTTLGLELLARGRADLCALHWGPAEESHIRHPALLRRYPQHREWVLVRAFHREQGLLLSPRCAVGSLAEAVGARLRWCLRPAGSGSQRFLAETLVAAGVERDALAVVAICPCEREAASQIARGLADIAPGSRAAAAEFGLGFLATGWEAFDLAMPRGVFFRRLLQRLLEGLNHPDVRALAHGLGGYDFVETGRLVVGCD